MGGRCDVDPFAWPSLMFPWSSLAGHWSRQATPDWEEGDASLPPRTSRRHNEERRRVADEEETVLDAAETGSVGSLDRGENMAKPESTKGPLAKGGVAHL